MSVLMQNLREISKTLLVCERICEMFFPGDMVDFYVKFTPVYVSELFDSHICFLDPVVDNFNLERILFLTYIKDEARYWYMPRKC